jgi:formate--tetrahydrofolate ligase
LGGVSNGFPREAGFDITVASEVMAILCLSSSLMELRERLGDIVVGYTRKREPVTARDLKAHGPMTVLLKDAIKPNLVQTLEGNPALIHGGPFANIAHGCNSVIATRTALKLADYVVTEAGFGADLGAEKFIDIKCRKSGLRPDAVVLVATLRALRFHGGAKLDEVSEPDPEKLAAGLVNLERHLHNLKEIFGLSCVVAINRFVTDRQDELDLLRARIEAHGVPVAIASHWEDGGAGARDLAEAVRTVASSTPGSFRFAYDDEMPLVDKVAAVAKKLYGAGEVAVASEIRAEIRRLEKAGYGRLPICIAKTQYSFSTDPKAIGAPQGHSIRIRGVRLAAGAGFVVVLCGAIMTMPGLPKRPSAEKIDIDENGHVVGLF